MPQFANRAKESTAGADGIVFSVVGVWSLTKGRLTNQDFDPMMPLHEKVPIIKKIPPEGTGMSKPNVMAIHSKVVEVFLSGSCGRPSNRLLGSGYSHQIFTKWFCDDKTC